MLQFTKQFVHRLLGPEWFLTIAAVRQIHKGYEPAFREFLSLLETGGTLLDIGANTGITCAVAKRNRPDLNLVAFEPVPQNVKVLKRIRSLYSISRMEIMATAISDMLGTVTLAIPSVNGLPGTALSHVVSDEFHNPDVEKHPYTTVEVPVTTLDSLEFDRVAGIKIDVEDHEYHVINGARCIVQKHRPMILCELWGTDNRPRTIELMKSLNYSVVQKGDIDFLFTPDA